MALKPHTRSFVKVAFAALFLVLAPYLIVKMLGFVIDLKHWRLAKAGSLYVKFLPREATLAINDEPYPASAGYLSHDIYIPGLAPDTYDVSLTLNNYSPWRKKLVVEPGKVAFGSDIVLWPERISTEGSSTNISFFRLTSGGVVTNGTSSALSFQSVALRGSTVFASMPDSNTIVTKSADRYYAIDLATPGTAIPISERFAALQRLLLRTTSVQPMRDIRIHPFSPAKLLIMSNTSVYQYDMKKDELEILIKADKLTAFTADDDEVLTIDGKGALIAENLLVHTITKYPAHLGFARHIVSDAGGKRLLIEDEAHDLYLFDRSLQTLKKVGTNVVFSSFSPDDTRAIFIDANNTMSVLYLVDNEENVVRHAGDIDTFILENGEEAATFAWVPFAPNYFFIRADSKLLVEEFDVRPPRNIAVLARNARDFALAGDHLYLLRTNGTLSWGPVRP